MRAFQLDSYGQPLRQVDVLEPTVGDQDVLVGVEAAGVNHLDEKIRAGEFRAILPYATPLVLGHDVAGTVVATGARVTGFAPGDRVYSRPRDHRIGTFAERIAIDQADVAPAPTSISTAEAGSLPLVALTAWQALVERANVQAGDKVLIHAGAGGVGTIAIQLAKHLGARVATTASAASADLVRELGADLVLDHRAQDFEEEISGYDVVLDSLGGETLRKSLRVLRPGGRAIGIAGPPDPAFAKEQGLNPVVRLAVAGLSRRTRALARKADVTYEFLFMHSSGARLREIARLVDAGALRPVVGATFPFDQTVEALSSLGRSGVRGKTVVTGPSSSI